MTTTTRQDFLQGFVIGCAIAVVGYGIAFLLFNVLLLVFAVVAGTTFGILNALYAPRQRRKMEGFDE